jgi:hypothetical protein
MNLSDTLRNPERMYEHFRLGLTLVSGSDLNWLNQQIENRSSDLNTEDKQLLKDNWTRVRARLVADGCV